VNAPPPPQSDTSILKGVKVLVEGPTGTGKTYSLGTLVDTGLDVFYLGIDSGRETLMGYYSDRGKPIPGNLHWHDMETADWSFKSMIAAAESTTAMTYDSLTKVIDPYKSQYNQFVTLLRTLTDFPDDNTGRKFGAVDSWGTDKVFVIDALVGINTCVMSMVVGTKPVVSPGEWQVGMQHVEKFIKKLVSMRCHFVLISHVERELDEIEGGLKITVGTLGKKLAPKLPPMFGDVILAQRQGAKWHWSTANTQADLKTRNLPVAEGIPPDFGAIIRKWESRGGKRTP
jgi:AAA domain